MTDEHNTGKTPDSGATDVPESKKSDVAKKPTSPKVESEERVKEKETEKSSSSSSSDTKKSKAKSSKNSRIRKRKQKQKIYLGSGIVGVIVITAILVANGTFTAGSRLQMNSSVNPTGYYRLAYDDYNQHTPSDLDFTIDMITTVDGNHVANGSIVLTDGKFPSGTNVSAAYYSQNQSYACLFKDGYKPSICPIEASEDEMDATVNTIDIIKRGRNSELSVEIKIAQVIGSATVNWQSLTQEYLLEAGSTYNIGITVKMDRSANPYASSKVGGLSIIPDYFLRSRPEFAMTWAVNQSNYDAHCFMLNCSMLNVTSVNTGVAMDISEFTYSAQNYTMLQLPTIFAHKTMSAQFSFVAGESKAVNYCIWDGALDAAFDSEWSYYKYGGFLI